MHRHGQGGGGADPRAEFGSFTPLVMREAIGLVGPAIGAFHSRVCGGDPLTALAVLRAARLKLITPMALKSAAAGQTTADAPALRHIVRRKISEFGRQSSI